MQKGHTWAISRYRCYIQRANFGTKTLSYILLLSNFLFKIWASIHHMVLNPFTPMESPFDKQNCMALDRVKSIKSLLGVKGLREIVFQPFHSQGVSLWRAKLSGVRQSKIYKEIRKLTFRALVLRRSESRNCGLCVVYIQREELRYWLVPGNVKNNRIN